MVFAEAMAFRFSTSVAVNSAGYFNINVHFLLGTRDERLCRQKASPFLAPD